MTILSQSATYWSESKGPAAYLCSARCYYKSSFSSLPLQLEPANVLVEPRYDATWTLEVESDMPTIVSRTRMGRTG